MTHTLSETQRSLISYHNAGYIPIPLNGKIPVVKGWQDTQYDLDLPLEKFPGNFGLVLQDDDLVIDVDPRNFPANDNPFARLVKDFSIDRNASVVVRTGAGGNHLYFKKPSSISIRETLDQYPGIEFKSKGRQVVGAASIHPDTKKPYELRLGSLTNVPAAPSALLDAIKVTTPKLKHVNTEKYEDKNEDIERFIDYLANAPIAIEGDHGDKTTFTVACFGRDLGLSPDITLGLMDEYFNPRCLPPWDFVDLKTKVDNAYHYAHGEAGKNSPDKDFVEIKEVATPDFHGWDTGRNGQRLKTLRNVVNCFLVDAAKNPLYKSLAFDEFRGQVVKVKQLPWDGSGSRENPTQWTDGDSKSLRYHLGTERRMDFNTNLLDEGVYNVALSMRVHPIRDYLNGLKWDGTPRLGSWLVDYLGADDTIYTREVSKKTLLQAVMRAFQPGSKADYVLILEGNQGIGKSTVVQILGGKYYADIVIDPHSRDTVDAMRGAWFIEFSEMEVTRRAEAQSLKAFITRSTDKCRLAYGKNSIEYPRSCIFIGTINPNACGEYLVDTTGNRRFWPVLVKKIKLDALRADRDQLFAEAVACYKRGERPFIEDKHVLEAAFQEQEKRRTGDPWEHAIREYLGDNELARTAGVTTAKDIWIYALRGSESNFQRVHAHRIGDVLRDLGWSYGVHWYPPVKGVMRCFRKVMNGQLLPEEDIYS